VIINATPQQLTDDQLLTATSNALFRRDDAKTQVTDWTRRLAVAEREVDELVAEQQRRRDL
jgi:hypothetical protein